MCDAPHYVNSRTDFDNKMYDVDVFSEEDHLKPRDLLSFARQIALGMVSSNHYLKRIWQLIFILC